MINNYQLTIDTLAKVGVLPAIDSNWTNATTIFPGSMSVGSYNVPTGKRFKLKAVYLSGDYANIPRMTGLSSFDLGTVLFQVDGATVMESRVQWAGGTFTANPIKSDFGASQRMIRGMLGAMDFTSGQVIRMIVNPAVVAGTIPQILWLPTLYFKDTVTGETIIENARTITTTGTASQVIITYTVPANGVTLKGINLTATSADFIMGFGLLCVNGAPFLEIPLISNTYNTVAGQNRVILHDGITFGENTVFEARCDIVNSLNQKIQFTIAGTEETIGEGGAQEVSYIF